MVQALPWLASWVVHLHQRARIGTRAIAPLGGGFQLCGTTKKTWAGDFMLVNGSTNYSTPAHVGILGCEVSYELPRASRPWNCIGDLGGGPSVPSPGISPSH